jgi:diguanylate cyclase (GGDEF)-like protein
LIVMEDPPIERTSVMADGAHFSCSLTAVLLARVHAFGGDEAVVRLLRESGVTRTPEYLAEIGNWVSYDEAVALWRTGASITMDPQFAWRLGEDAMERLKASPVAALLRSLGSPEEVYRQMATTASKFSVVAAGEAVQVRPGYAEIRMVPVEGFPRDANHCAWTAGLLTQTPVLFGLAPAMVEHDRCGALGAPDCVYRVIWDAESAAEAADSPAQTAALKQQLAAMTERLQSMFATASDLIAAGDLDVTLAQITDRAAVEVRAPRYLLAVRPMAGDEPHIHHRGFDADEAYDYAERILTTPIEDLPRSWLVVPVRSHRSDYGRLLAMYGDGQGFFAQERELLEVYARYAATALDTATALAEARRRHDQASALLELARALATAGASDEVAQRLVDAVPSVVDCDRVGVYLWDEEVGELRGQAIHTSADDDPEPADWSVTPGDDSLLREWLAHRNLDPQLVDADHGHPPLRELLAKFGAVSSIVVPISSREHFLGAIAVSVTEDELRLRPSPDLLDRLSGIAAHATTALENGRLVDRITHQARHDGLTGLANRAELADALARATTGTRHKDATFSLFYIDLDDFKPINDELGHQVGDELLCAVSERLSACVREADTVARIGGDEFAALVNGISEGPESDQVLARLRGAFAEPFDLSRHRVSVGASIGRAVWPRDAADIDSLIRYADAAMYEVKRIHHAGSGRTR